MERLDRNTIELLNEIRVAATGIQVMFGFLLIAPFSAGFRRVSSSERVVYATTLAAVAIAAVLLMAPSIHHRLLFRHGEKRYLVALANRLAIMAMVFLCVGFSGIMVLISDVVLGGGAPAIVGVVALAGIAGLWFALPLLRVRREPSSLSQRPRAAVPVIDREARGRDDAGRRCRKRETAGMVTYGACGDVEHVWSSRGLAGASAGAARRFHRA